MNSKRVLKRYQKRKAAQDHWRALLEDGYDYTLPHFNTLDIRSKGEDVDDLIFDSTAVVALQSLAAEHQGNLVPPFEEWIDYDIAPSIKRQLTSAQTKEIEKQLAEQKEITFEVLQDSNFDVEVTPSLLQSGISTGSLHVDHGDIECPLYFSAYDVNHLVVEESRKKLLENVYRNAKYDAEDLEIMWPEAEWSKRTREIIKKGSDEEVEVLDAIVKDEQSGSFHYFVIEQKSEHGDEHVALQKRIDSSPWVAFRINKAPGEHLGRGPVLLHLGDIKTANKAKEIELRNGMMQSSGMFMYNALDGLVNPDNLELGPGSMIPDAGGQIPSLRPLTPPGDVRLATIIKEDLRSSIREGMLNAQLPPLEGGTKTATEIAANLQEHRKRITPSTNRLFHEFVKPLVKRIRFLLIEKGYFQPIEAGDRKVVIVPRSPLAKLAEIQKIADQQSAILTADSVDPEARRVVFNSEKWIADSLKKGGVESDYIRSEEQREQLRQQMQQMRAAEVAAASQQQGGQ